MSHAGAATISRVSAAAYTIATDLPESDGTFAWDSTTIVIAHVSAGDQEGIGYSYAAPVAARIMVDDLAPDLVGCSAIDIPRLAAAMSHRLRNSGRPGIGATAASALDTALWDLKARLLNVSLLDLLGAARSRVAAYGSGGFTSYSDGQLRDQLGSWASDGFAMVKMKIGRDPARDPHRVETAREAIGDGVELFVDANGAFAVGEALGAAAWLGESDVRWFEEPVSSDDASGMRHVRERVPLGMAVAAGEYCWTPVDFVRLIDAAAVDVLQADATRCLGISGFLGAAQMCRARGIPMSTHCAPSLHAQLGCVAEAVRHIEWFHDHVRIEQLFFDGAAVAVDGAVSPDRSRRGIGLELRAPDVDRFLVWKGAFSK